jgi:Flp pilus assembly protein TadG
MRTQPHSDDPRCGTAAVELAVCLPIIVVLCLASIEACTMIYLKQSLSIAAYEGARTANVEGMTNDDVFAVCEQILNDRRVQSATVDIDPVDITAMIAGEVVTVACSAPCDANAFVFSKYFGGKSLSGTARFIKKY